MDAIQPGNVSGNNYDKYASKNPIERKMMAGFFDALGRMLDGLDPEIVVEIGAGEGRITEHLVERFPNATVVGLDLPDTNLAEEWDEIDVPMFFGDATRMPFVDNSIDLVVGLEVLEHVPEPERALADIARVLPWHRCAVGAARADLAGRQRRPRPIREGPRQHPGPRQPLVVESVRALRGHPPRRHRFGAAVAVDDGARRRRARRATSAGEAGRLSREHVLLDGVDDPADLGVVGGTRLDQGRDQPHRLTDRGVVAEPVEQ